jgi:hypothetical protein
VFVRSVAEQRTNFEKRKNEQMRQFIFVFLFSAIALGDSFTQAQLSEDNGNIRGETLAEERTRIGKEKTKFAYQPPESKILQSEAEIPPKKTIILPINPILVEPHPVPKPVDPTDPKVIDTIKADEMFVIESPVELIVLASPVGVLSVENGVGPIRVRGKFCDGGGGIETRTYKSEYVYFVTTEAKVGKSELILIPHGVVDEADVIRQVLTISGTGPNPPPDPDPDPKPEPEPDPEPVSDKLLIEVVEDTLNRAPDTAIVLNAIASWNELKEKGHDWRIYDKKTSEPKGIQAVKDVADTPLPAMVIRDLKTGKVIRVVTLPLTFDVLKRIISELTGG